MEINFKILNLLFLAANLDCQGSESIMHDRGGWDKTVISRTSDDSDHKGQSGPSSHLSALQYKELVVFKTHAKQDFESDTNIIWTDRPVVQSWQESFLTVADPITVANMHQQIRRAQVAYHANSLLGIHTFKALSESEKKSLVELTTCLTTK